MQANSFPGQSVGGFLLVLVRAVLLIFVRDHHYGLWRKSHSGHVWLQSWAYFA